MSTKRKFFVKMYQQLFCGLLLAMLLQAMPALAQEAVHSTAASKSAHARYTCVMHPELVSDQPGNCPKCGMKLTLAKAPPTRTEHHDHSAASHAPAHAPMTHMSMQSSVNIAEPMSRESSGTAWVPDSTPMYGHMFMFGQDMLMLHGAIWPRYVNASTDRGDDRIDAPNWIMAMYSHPFGENAQLGFRTMMSLDPLTEGGRGYPLLFQSGESWNGEPLHDRQHPHDFVAELSMSYSQKFTKDFSSCIYFGMPGEPALGPPTFMHRLSAMDDPDAPISHHWQDSTHITFGVATLGLVWKNFKAEGSIFTGREPDEDRYAFDRPRFDSYSGRLSWNPNENLALQISHGYLKSPEGLEPQTKIHRTSASLIYNRPIGPDANWSNSLVWGQNNATGEGKTESFLVETNFQWRRETVYARLEYVEKSGHELSLAEEDHGNIFGIGAYTIGYVHDFVHGPDVDLGLGGQFTLNSMPDSLERYYGGDTPYSFQVFLRLRPSRMSHGTMAPEGMLK